MFLVFLRNQRGVTLVGCRNTWQHGHGSRLLARATVSLRRMVAMELGMWRSDRGGGAVGSSTTGNGRFRAVTATHESAGVPDRPGPHAAMEAGRIGSEGVRREVRAASLAPASIPRHRRRTSPRERQAPLPPISMS